LGTRKRRKMVCQQPESYVVTTLGGLDFRRNQRAINCCKVDSAVYPGKATAQTQSAISLKASAEQQQPIRLNTSYPRQQSVFSFPALPLPRSVFPSQPSAIVQPP
jgi:hypothetical protein